MVYYDFNKLAFAKIKENPQEYLIIDLADQSRDIVLLEDYPNTSLTKTSAILEMLNKLKLKYLIKNIEEYSKEELYSYIKSLTDLILPLYEPGKIILNKVELQNEYYETEDDLMALLLKTPILDDFSEINNEGFEHRTIVEKDLFEEYVKKYKTEKGILLKRVLYGIIAKK